MTAAAGVILVLGAAGARGESLAEAIALAYQTNPTLQSQRAQVRGVDEGYVQARAALGPTAALQATAAYDQTRFGYASPSATNNGQVQLNVSQALYTGGREALGVSAARAQIAAARQSLRATEGNVILAVIQAYADVIRDAKALTVRAKNLKVLADQVTQARARVRDGELTRTDVAQAEAQLASERALYSTAQGQLQLSRAAYATVVGRDPGDLDPMTALPGLPATIDLAFDEAADQSPELTQSKYAEIGSRDRVAVARAAHRPTITLNLTAGYTGSLVPFSANQVERVVMGQAVISQPLFTSGLIGSQIRQALDQNTGDRIAIEITRRAMVQNVANAWNQMLVSRSNVGFQAENIRAAEIAFRGMTIEYREGLRATLDVLIAEETLRDAELSLLAAEHDQYVAEATLLRVIGRLEGPALLPGLPRYDVTANLHRVENRGAVPWSSLIETLDAMGAPNAGQGPISAPRAMDQPSGLAPPNTNPVTDGLVTSLRTAPIPGTVGPEPPVQLP